MNPWFVMVLGMGTVFIGLICIILLTKLMSAVIKGLEQKKQGQPMEKASAPEAVAQPCLPVIPERAKLDAVIAAAVASYMGGDVSGLRIHSLKCLCENGNDRKQFVAALAASVATAMDTDVSGLRIHKITKI